MLWDQSLESIHYRTLLIFQKKPRFESQNMEGGYIPHPPGIYALGYFNNRPGLFLYNDSMII